MTHHMLVVAVGLVTIAASTEVQGVHDSSAELLDVVVTTDDRAIYVRGCDALSVFSEATGRHLFAGETR